MMESNGERTSGQHSESTTTSPNIGRRPLLAALGASTALSLGAGPVAGATDRRERLEGEESDDDQIHPVFGYATTDAASIPERFDPEHEVTMLAAPPAGPEQPAFLAFDPVGLHVSSGDIVQFTAMSPDHTVTAFHSGIGFEHNRVPADSQPFSSPVLGPGAAWLYQFETEGVYDVYCGPHHLMGMVMRIVVGDVGDDELPEYATSVDGLPSEEVLVNAFSQPEGNELSVWPYVTSAEIFGSDRLHPSAIQDDTTVPFGDVAEALGYEFEPPGSETKTPGGNETSSD